MNGAEPKGTLLCVDDEPNILSALRRVFRPQGYRVLVAGSGAEGLEILADQPVDLVISDMRMPAMSGAEFLARVAEGWPRVMRLLLTGYAEMDDAVQAINDGHIYGYYNKPWEDAEMRLAVENALRQKRLTEEKESLLEQLEARNRELKALNEDLDGKVRVRTAQLQTALGRIESAHKDLKHHYSDTVKAFSRFVGLRDGSTTAHTRRVAERAQRVARELGVAGAALQDILFAALLLEVGKLALSDRLLGRHLNAMSKTERDTYFHHAVTGAAVLKDIAPLRNACRLIAMQYEAFDGSGLPHGVAGEDIPLGARILAAVRDYDLYLEGGMAGRPLSASEAQQQLHRLRGKKYDPVVVDALIRLVGRAGNRVHRPVIDASPLDLVPGMEVVEVIYGGQVFLRDVVLTAAMIEEITALQGQVDTALSIKVRARK